MADKPNFQTFAQDVAEGVLKVSEGTIEAFAGPERSQEDKRKAFQQAVLTPETMEALRLELGDDEFNRQMTLGLRRAERGQ